MKKYFVIFLSITMILAKLHAKEKDSPNYVRYVDQIISSFSKEMHKNYSLECIGDGGRMPYDVEEISLRFVAYRRATVEEARELEVKTTERLVQIINAHEKIRPSLREYPFPASRARVSVSFRESKKSKAREADNDVALVFQANGRIFYQAYTPENPHVAKDIKDETYEEALKIVQKDLAKNSPTTSKNVSTQATGSVASREENAKVAVVPEKGCNEGNSPDEMYLRELRDIFSEARKEHGFYNGK
jgi:hypothetical protein